MTLNAVHKIIIVQIILCVPLLLWGQYPVLDAYVARGLSDNSTLLRQRLIESERLLAVELASTNRRPVADLRSDYLLSAGGRSIDIPIGSLINPINTTLNGLSGSEQLPTSLENVETRFIPSNFHDSRLEVRMPLLQPLIRREEAVRRAQVQGAVAETAVLENQLRHQIKDLYYAYLQSLTGLEIIDSSRRALLEVRRLNEVLVRNDKATRDALYRTDAELAELAGRAAQLEQQRAIAQAALNRLLDRELATLIEIDSVKPSDGVGPSDGPTPSDGLKVTIRPELQQLDAGLLTLDRQQDLIQAERLPTLGVLVQGGAQGFLNGDFSGQPYTTLALGFSWNLYDGGKRDLRGQRTRLQREQLQLQRDDTERALALELWQADQRITSETAQLTAATARIRASQEALRITELRYRTDQALFVEYLDARTQLTRATLEHNLSFYRLLQARAAREAALGLTN